MAENLPQPESREETFLAKAAGEDVTLPEPESRKELFLKAIAENGGGGGGTSYTAGAGIEIANNTISVDTTAIQEKLTAGANITIANNVISATGGGSAVTQLTSSDYNWNEAAQDATTTPFDSVALWLLPTGYYRSAPGVKVLLNMSKQAYGYPYYSCCFLVAKATDTGGGSMVDILEMTSDEAPDQTPRFYRTSAPEGGAVGAETNGTALLSSWGLKTGTGTSTTSTMSQNAISSMVFNDPATKEQVKIGVGASSNRTNSIAVGRMANANGNNGMALGYSATAGENSVALGKSATTSRVGEVNIGAGNSGDGYNNTNYRLLGGVHNPLDNHDAATKGYVDSAYSAFTGATPSANGTAGLVPAPNIADRDKFLKADGTWAAVSGGGGGGNTSIRDLDSNDLNWNTTAGDSVTTPFDAVALWLMPSGTYYVPETFAYGVLPNVNNRADYAAPGIGSFITVSNTETSGVPAIVKCTGDIGSPFTEVQEVDYDTGGYASGTYEDSETHTLAVGNAAGQFGTLWVSPDDPNNEGLLGRYGDLCSDITNFDLYMCTYSDPSVPESTWTKLNMSNNP